MVGRRVVLVVLCFLVPEHQGNRQPKVGTECVNQHGATDVRSHEHVHVQSFVGGVEHELEECDDDELEGGGPPENCSHSDENSGTGKVRAHQTVCV